MFKKVKSPLNNFSWEFQFYYPRTGNGIISWELGNCCQLYVICEQVYFLSVNREQEPTSLSVHDIVL